MTGLAESPHRDKETVLDEYQFLRSQGVDNNVIHKQLRMTRGAFTRMMYRAKADGDRRAVEFVG